MVEEIEILGVELNRRRWRCEGGGDVKTHLSTLQSGQRAAAAAAAAAVAAGSPTALWVGVCRKLRLIEQGRAVAQSVVVFGCQTQLIGSLQQRRLENLGRRGGAGRSGAERLQGIVGRWWR